MEGRSGTRVKMMRFVFILCTLLMLTACATSDAVTDRQPGQLMVCHEGKSINVSNANMFVHESHGDSLGPCPDGS